MCCFSQYSRKINDMLLRFLISGIMACSPPVLAACSYFFSFYFSMIIFTGFGDNDFFAHNPLETCFIIGYLFCNIILQAYILGESGQALFVVHLAHVSEYWPGALRLFTRFTSVAVVPSSGGNQIGCLSTCPFLDLRSAPCTSHSSDRLEEQLIKLRALLYP